MITPVRRGTGWSLALAGVLTLAACSQTASSSGSSSSTSSSGSSSGTSSASSSAASGGTAPVTLTFWGTYGNGGNTSQTSVLNGSLIPAFEKAHPGVMVKYVDLPYDGLKQKLTTSAAGGQLPDLVRSDIGWVAQFAKLKVFQRLDGTMPDFAGLAKATYPGTLATNAYQGGYYGLPLDTNTRVLITSPAALKAAGMTQPPATFEQLKTMGSKLKGKNIAVFADSGLQGWNVLPWIWSGGGSITDPGISKASGYLDGPKSVAAVQMLVDLYKAGEIPNLLIGNQGATSTSDGLPKAKYATILDGPWMHDIWKAQYKKFAPVYSSVPAGPGGSVSVVGGESIVMASSTKHQKAAEDFIRFTQSDQFQLGMAKTGQMTVMPHLAGQETAIAPYYKTFAAQLQTARARLSIPQSAQVDTILNDSLTPAFKGSTSVQAALTTAAKQIDPLLANKS